MSGFTNPLNDDKYFGFRVAMVPMMPFPLPGDFNDDGQYTPADLDLLFAAIDDGGPVHPYDMNGDNQVTLADLTYQVEQIIGSHLGDTDLDLDVDLSDLGNLATNYSGGMPAHAGWAEGDTDCDGDVDLADLGNLATNYGQGEAQALSGFHQLVGIPEPTAVGPLAGVSMLLRRKRSSR